MRGDEVSVRCVVRGDEVSVWCVVRAEDAKFLPVRRERLCGEKLYVKLLRRQQKDGELTKRRHQKERALMQRAHCIVIDKLVATHDKEKLATEKSVEKKLKKNRYRYFTTCFFPKFTHCFVLATLKSVHFEPLVCFDSLCVLLR